MSLAKTTYAFSLVWFLSQLSGPLVLEIHAEEIPVPKPSLQTFSFDPLLTQEFPSSMSRLLVIAALSLDGKLLESDEAEILWNKTQKMVNSKEASPQPEAIYNITLQSARLLQYFLSRDVSDRIEPAAKWLETYGRMGAEATKKPSTKAKFQYFQHLGRFFLSEGLEGFPELIALRPQLQGEKEKVLAANLDLLNAQSLAMSLTTAPHALTLLNQASPALSPFGKIIQKLLEASMDIGIDAEGKVVGSIKASYEGKLSAAMQLTKTLPAASQTHVLNTAIYIWNKAQGGKENRAPAYLSQGFKGQRPSEALREREALSLIRAQNYKAAVLIYQQIAESLSDMAFAVDQRLWEIDVLIYQKSGSIAELEKSYVRLRERYRIEAKKKGGEVGASKLWQTVLESYRGVIDQMIAQAQQTQSSSALKNQTVLTLVSFCKIEADSPFIQTYKLKLAQLYRSQGQFREATDLYLELARKDPSPKLLLAAIEAQSQLAKWPAQPPFEALPTPGPQEERAKLLSIFEKLVKANKTDDWFALSHLGLLHRSLGQEKAMDELWRPALSRAQASQKLALEAGGSLLSLAHSGKRWQDVIDLSHLFLSKKLPISQKGKAITISPWLGEALFQGGSADLKSKNFARAVKHLEEFVLQYANDPRVPNALHGSALAYVGMNKYTPALNACRSIADKYPAYPPRPKLLLQAAEWAQLDKTTIEFAIFFYTKYLNDYKSETNIPQIRVLLAEIYFKRRLYGWASRLYREQSQAPGVSKELQLQAAIKVMDIEEKYGELKDAAVGAQRILQLTGPQDPSLIRAIAFQGRYLAQSKDLKGIGEAESRLMPLAPKSKEALEALGQLRFRKAELTTQNIINDENNLQIRDPEATVKKYADRFEAEKQPYLNVCQYGTNTMCAPAYWRLMELAGQAYEAVEKVEIADTLGQARINNFKSFKQLHLSKILASKKELRDQALKLAKQGTTTEAWREEITKAASLEDSTPLAH